MREAETARAEAEAANRAKDQFLAMLGHELRNPLAPIVTALDLAKLRGTSAIEARDIERPVRQVQRLVDDLLDTARVARGTLVLEKRPLEISVAVRDAVEAVQPAVAEASHALRTDVPATGLTVDGDAGRLTQVVSNLLLNAVRFTDPGGVILVEGSRQGDQVVLRVSDNGQGIDAELLPRIFEAFVTSRAPGLPHGAGLGLGLAIVRNIVEFHGGTVSADSDGRGRGSTFEIRLPASVSPPVAADATPRGLTPVAVARKILIVDDNRDAANTMGEALRLVGHEVALAYRAEEALQRLESFIPDVALLDVGLPDMNGRDLGGELRRRNAAMKLIAITGYGQLSDREASRRAGFAAHLVKPVGIRELIDHVGG